MHRFDSVNIKIFYMEIEATIRVNGQMIPEEKFASHRTEV